MKFTSCFNTFSRFNTFCSLMLLVLGFSVCNPGFAAVTIEKMDRIIAVVNDSVITEQELADRISTVTAQLEKQGTPLPPDEVLQKQILERLIADSLQLQLAAQTGIKVDETQLDKTVERIAEQNKMNISQFKDALEKEGISYAKFRNDMRNEITIARLKEREVDDKVNVSEGEIDNYLTTQANRKDNDGEYEVSHIMVRTPEDSSPEDIEKAREKVNKVLSELNAGKPFEQVSAAYSDAPNALEGGNMGWKNSGQIPALFLDQLQDMAEGDISKPIRSPNGFHVLKLNHRRGGNSTLMVDQTHVRHILIKLSEVVSDQDAKQKIDGLEQRLDSGAKFDEIARQYSEDGSASNGGDLGWVNPGDTVPQFESVMNALAPGEISAPVRSPFGWHIIQVIERRKQDMTKEAARLKARQEIRARKADETYQDWLHELRDSAFVELRLEDKY